MDKEHSQEHLNDVKLKSIAHYTKLKVTTYKHADQICHRDNPTGMKNVSPWAFY